MILYCMPLIINNKTMIKKAIYGVVAVGLLAASFSFSNQTTAKNEADYALPETEGVYDVPGNPHMKLRVFVYHAKPEDVEKEAKGGKPAPAAPTETCAPTFQADPNSSSAVSAAGWKLPAFWQYRVNPDSAPASVGAGNAEKLILNGYNEWQNILGSKVAFSRGANTAVSGARQDSQNIVAWGRTSGTALAVTYTWYIPSTGQAVEIDTIMNKKFTWYWSDPLSWPAGQTCAYSGVYDAQNILTHELGHTVGLNDHYTGDYADNTMFGYGSKGETKKNTLTAGDIAGAQMIY